MTVKTSEAMPSAAPLRRSQPAAFGSGALIGTLGGLIGLGGAEFRLPLLISYFGFQGLEAVILNKATSLVVVATALPFRASSVSFAEIGAHWPIVVNLLAGSLVGAWAGAEWATRLRSETLYKVIAVLLVIIAGVLLFAHGTTAGAAQLGGWPQIAAGVVAGFIIGVVAALLGVAGGEFLIPTFVLLFGADLGVAVGASVARRRDQATHRPELEPPSIVDRVAAFSGFWSRAHLSSFASDLPPHPEFRGDFSADAPSVGSRK